MERIKEALAKAKANQQSTVGQPAQNSPSEKAGASSVHQAQPFDELQKVDYDQTSVVRLQAEFLEKNRIVALDKSNPFAMSFDLLRTQILQKMEANGWRTLAITSPTPGSGKTVISINLAISIAHQVNKTAMLVDFDLRRPKVATYLGLRPEKSLNDLLEGNAEIHEAIVNPSIQRLVVLPTQHSIKESSETLSSKKIANLVTELRERYESRIVIFDLPPVLVSDDVISILPQMDCVLMVVANGMSTKKEIDESLGHIPPEKLIGVVYNKSETETTPYYYD